MNPLPLAGRTQRHLTRSFCFLAALCAGSLSAQTTINGTIFDGSGGPLVSGTVYHTSGSLTVPAGETLTIQAGAIVKLGVHRITVDGTLDLDGTSGSPVQITSLADDSAGGDTNADGPSSGSPGNWQGILISAGGLIEADHATIRFSGSSGFSGVHSNGGNLTLRNCSVSDSSSSGIDMNGHPVLFTIEDSSFNNNSLYAVNDAHIDSLTNLSNNSASGNGSGDFIRITNGTPNVDLTITTGMLLNDVLAMAAIMTVNEDRTLSLEQDVVLKWLSVLRMTVAGTVQLNGIANHPVVITSGDDDSFLGDTTLNGATSGSPGDWQGVIVNATGTLNMDNAIVRYSGSSGFSAIHQSGGLITASQCRFIDGAASGIDLNGHAAPVSISDCFLDNNGFYAINDVNINSLTDFQDNSASGNGAGNYYRVINGTLAEDINLTKANLLGDVMMAATNCTVPDGFTLSIEGGIVWKWGSVLRMTIGGVLNLNGGAPNPIVFTSLADDDFGGDTNLDGPSSGAPSNWQGFILNATGSLNATHSTIRYSGSSGFSSINQSGGQLDLADCSLIDSSASGIDFNGNATPVSVVRCNMDDNGFYSVNEVHINTLPGFLDNTATGNGIGNYMRITNATPTVNTSVEKRNLIDEVFVTASSPTIGAGVQLIIKEGIAIKMLSVLRITANGSLQLKGTAFEPITVTSIEDDSAGGDSNLDGAASLPGPADWQGIIINSTATDTTLENVLVRYAGSSGFAGVGCFSADAELRSVRSEHSSAAGFSMSNHKGPTVNLVAFDNGGDGIDLTSGTFNLLHVTSTGNGGFGIDKGAAHGGKCHSAISWNNGSGNYDGYAAGELTFSNGSAALAGLNGNLNLDPQFVDASAAVGDLHLAPGSPMVDAGSYNKAFSVLRDHDEHSRMLDPTLSGTLLPDMGAYERSIWQLSVLNGTPATVGSFMHFRVGGPAGMATYMVGLLDGNSLDSPFGFITAGRNSLIPMGSSPVGSNHKLFVPAVPSLAGVHFAVQAKVLPTGSMTTGAISTLYRACLQPRIVANKRSKVAPTAGL